MREFVTGDIDIAAVLLTTGHKLIDFKQEQGGRTRFIFNDDEGSASKTVVDFGNGSLLLDPRSLLARWRETKNVGHSFRSDST